MENVNGRAGTEDNASARNCSEGAVDARQGHSKLHRSSMGRTGETRERPEAYVTFQVVIMGAS